MSTEVKGGEVRPELSNNELLQMWRQEPKKFALLLDKEIRSASILELWPGTRGGAVPMALVCQLHNSLVQLGTVTLTYGACERVEQPLLPYILEQVRKVYGVKEGLLRRSSQTPPERQWVEADYAGIEMDLWRHRAFLNDRADALGYAAISARMMVEMHRDRIRRVVRRMHVGECPKCFSLFDDTVMRRTYEHCHAWVTSPGGVKVPGRGWKCPNCHFAISQQEAQAALQTEEAALDLQVFEKWRREREFLNTSLGEPYDLAKERRRMQEEMAAETQPSPTGRTYTDASGQQRLAPGQCPPSYTLHHTQAKVAFDIENADIPLVADLETDPVRREHRAAQARAKMAMDQDQKFIAGIDLGCPSGDFTVLMQTDEVNRNGDKIDPAGVKLPDKLPATNVLPPLTEWPKDVVPDTPTGASTYLSLWLGKWDRAPTTDELGTVIGRCNQKLKSEGLADKFKVVDVSPIQATHEYEVVIGKP